MFTIDVNKVPSKRAIAVIIVAFAIIIAPYFFLFQYYKQWFEKAGIIHILLTSISIGFPLFLLNTVAYIGKPSKYYKTNDISNEPWFFWVALGSLWTIFVLYAPGLNVICNYILVEIGHHKKYQVVTHQVATVSSIGAQLSVIILSPIIQKRMIRKRNANQPNCDLKEKTQLETPI